MFQSYQLKWCFVLIGIITISSLFAAPLNLADLSPWRYLGHIFIMTISILPAWMINAYFKTHQFPGIDNRAKFFISTLCGMIVILLVGYLITSYMPDTQIAARQELSLVNRIIGSFLVDMVCYIVFNIIHTNAILQKTQLENEQLKQAHLRGQLLSLQQQISPHFLFNSLSALKTIAPDKDTKKFVVQLSHVYRYLLSNNKHPVSSLKDELEFVKSYLYILHWRFEDALKVCINIPEEYNDYLIPSVSLQLLIENVIKHNVLTAEQPVDVNIYVDEAGELTVSNTWLPKKVPVDSTKLGLQNVRERFLLLFEKQITVRTSDSLFSVSLPLIRNERNNY
jgi:two-component system, LytTR family, sensor kinase